MAFKYKKGGYSFKRGSGYSSAPYRQSSGAPKRSYKRRDFKKRYDAKSGTDKNGKRYVRGWMVTKRHGLVSFFATEFSGTDEHKSPSGRVWCNWMVKVQPSIGAEYIASGLYEPSANRVFIPKMGIVLNASKGYCGYINKK